MKKLSELEKLRNHNHFFPLNFKRISVVEKISPCLPISIKSKRYNGYIEIKKTIHKPLDLY